MPDVPPLATSLGTIAGLLSVAIVWPQIWLSCVKGRTAGLSPLNCWLAVAINLTWLGYGLMLGDVVQISVNTLMALGNTAVLAALLKTQADQRTAGAVRRGLAVPSVLLGTVAALMVTSAMGITTDSFGIAILGLLGALGGVATNLVQPVSLLRDRTQDLSGISSARWALAGAAGAAWASYGYVMGQPAVWLGALFSIACAAVVLQQVSAARTRGVRAPAYVRELALA